MRENRRKLQGCIVDIITHSRVVHVNERYCISSIRSRTRSSRTPSERFNVQINRSISFRCQRYRRAVQVKLSFLIFFSILNCKINLYLFCNLFNTIILDDIFYDVRFYLILHQIICNKYLFYFSLLCLLDMAGLYISDICIPLLKSAKQPVRIFFRLAQTHLPQVQIIKIKCRRRATGVECRLKSF